MTDAPAPDRPGPVSGGTYAEVGLVVEVTPAGGGRFDAAPVAVPPSLPPAPRRTRPTSARARAAHRRRTRPAQSIQIGTRRSRATLERCRSVSIPPTGGRRRRGRRLTENQVQRRRALVAAALAATAVTGVGLAVVGVAVVRNSTAGRYVAPPAQPDEPGYEAYVVPTPTLAVVQPRPEGDLAGVTLLSLGPGDEGGTVLFVPPSTDAGSGADTLAGAYEDGGAEAVVEALGDVLGVAVDDHVEVDDTGWASLTGPVAPVTVDLPADVAFWPAGETALAAADVGRFLAFRSPGESELDQISRQALFWEAWLALVGGGGEGAVPGEAGVGLGRFVGGLAPEHDTAVLPVTAAAGGGEATTYEPDERRVAEVVAVAVPYPLSPAPGARVRVRLLNGTSDADLTSEVAPLLVEAGAEITIAGNASSFAVPSTTFAYRTAAEREGAERLADAVGVGRIEREAGSAGTEEAGSAPTSAEGEDGDGAGGADEIDVTIILGRDAQELIGRLESTG